MNGGLVSDIGLKNSSLITEERQTSRTKVLTILIRCQIVSRKSMLQQELRSVDCNTDTNVCGDCGCGDTSYIIVTKVSITAVLDCQSITNYETVWFSCCECSDTRCDCCGSSRNCDFRSDIDKILTLNWSCVRITDSNRNLVLRRNTSDSEVSTGVSANTSQLNRITNNSRDSRGSNSNTSTSSTTNSRSIKV